MLQKCHSIFRTSDLPKLGESFFGFRENGFSLHMGVLIQWDENHNARVLKLVEEMPNAKREQLLVVHEHEGCLAMLWALEVPDVYSVGEEVQVDDESWRIVESGCPA